MGGKQKQRRPAERRERIPYVGRPFEGLAGESDWVAMREIIPAGTAPLRLVGEQAGRDLTLVTLLPTGAPALVRASGEVVLAIQISPASGDVSRDLAANLERALAAEPGQALPTAPPPGPGPRLQDLLDGAGEPGDPPATGLPVTVHTGFDFWVADADTTPAAQAALEQANAAIVPTVRLASVTSAYWTRNQDRTFLRWVLPYDEEPLLDALARLHAAHADSLLEDSRFLGSFRAHGLLVPVWELPPSTAAEDCESPTASYLDRLRETLADPRPLTSAERGARAGLLNRQLTLA